MHIPNTHCKVGRDATFTLSVVIPALNDGACLAACLQAVLAELAANTARGPFEVIVVVPSAPVRITAIAARFPEVRIIVEYRNDLARVRQRGLQAAQGAILAYINANARMPAGWIGKALDAFDADNQVVFVGGPDVYCDVTPLMTAVTRLYWQVLLLPVNRWRGRITVGSTFAARADALVKLRGFDSTIPFYGHDTGLVRRLSGIGRVVFDTHLMTPVPARRLPIGRAMRQAAKLIGDCGRALSLQKRNHGRPKS